MSNQAFGLSSIDALKRKVQESEENLKAQRDTIMEQVKEAIRTGENEVINRMSVECANILSPFLRSVLIKDKRNTATFKLHLLYLVNDLLHKLLCSLFINSQMKEFEPILSKIFEQFQIRYRQYESQHLEFVRYTEQQIENIKSNLVNVQQSLLLQISEFTMNTIPPAVNLTSSTNYNLDPRLNPRDMNRFQFAGPVGSMPPAWNERFVMPFIVNMPPPKLVVPKAGLPTTSAFQSSSLKPRCMYYDLPAGVMVSMVPLEAQEYEPIDPHAVRVPVMMLLVNCTFLFVMLMFYNFEIGTRFKTLSPSWIGFLALLIKLLFSEGWEKLGMYEYYVAKDKAVAAKFQREKGAEERNRCVNSLVAEYSAHSAPTTSEASNERLNGKHTVQTITYIIYYVVSCAIISRHKKQRETMFLFSKALRL
ncbi:Calcium homeostasis endoplasmic reticulum protein [Trichuris trichiura]|uniref:Calcium homeostasis endoplasmic reticulum protein n=1 Tax=Trichuris trichiura TaxID=36087 RepID=A0A077ZD76_TRITR|nr:Calcium homeostasis endoplasmic reticulum protein [Trichuris trichiura]